MQSSSNFRYSIYKRLMMGTFSLCWEVNTTMYNLKKALAGLSAITIAMSLAACSGSNTGTTAPADPGSPAGTEAPEETTHETTTTTAATVAINTEPIGEEEQAAVDSAADKLRDIELENKEIKWLCHWDLNPDTTGKSMPVPLSLFQTKYGGSIKWYPTTWENRYSDLSTMVLGGEGIDFFQRDGDSLPKGIVSGMFEPIDEYIDINDPLYDDVRAAMDAYSFKGRHYAFVNDVSPNGAVIYSAKTIDENGLDDPWELYQNGEWNWDSFTRILEEFCDAENEQYGLDGWWSEEPLYLSAGVPAISSKDGQMVVNMRDPNMEKAQNWMYSLYNKGLVFDKSLFDWSTQVQFMGEGKEVFFVAPLWTIQGDPSTWTCPVPPEDVRCVPVPCPADAEELAYDVSASGYCLCKGAQNPLGVALYVECELLAGQDPDTVAVNEQKWRDDNQWNDELIEQVHVLNEVCKEHPVMEMANGVSKDLSDLLTYADTQGIKASMHGTDWATTRDEMTDVVQMLVDEFNGQLAATE